MSNKTLSLVFLGSLMIFTSCAEKPHLPVIDFTFEDNQNGPVKVSFINNTQFADAYFWDFGDGNFSKEAEPVNYYYLPGKYTVSLKATNADGSAEDEKFISIKGTTYQVYNYCSATLNSLIGFYSDGVNIYDIIGFGNVPVRYLSSYVYTTRNSIYLGYKVADHRYFIVSTPYTLISDQHNVLQIDDYKPGYYTDDSIFN